ncbi:hypothetical protein WAF17_22565 (plasmid) [Bernardetia sp. ABR2-2B]|uniref:hypothetical protein n=1 Tax=Bernardetia sp. ABR2-2B TaxID=3127472 RepID=UPI0030CCADCF
MKFFDIIRKSSNAALNAVRNTAIYDFAEEKLTPQTYAETARPLFLLSKHFSNLYHFMSFSVSFLGIFLIAESLKNWIYFIILIVLGLVLFAVIEIAKSNTSHHVFSSIARKEKSNSLFLAILIITTLFSFFLSVYSANKAVYFYSTNDKFSENVSMLQTNVDSINNQFSTQISSIETSLQTSQNTLENTNNKWLRIAANKDIETSQKALTDVLAAKKKAIAEVEEKHKESTTSTSSDGQDVAKIAAFVFGVFELLNIVAYYFYYLYLSNCLLEKNGVLAGVGTNTPVNNQPVITPSFTMPSFTTPNYTTPAPTNHTTTTSRKIGFEYGSNSPVNTPTPSQTGRTTYSSSFKIDTCEFSHCGKKYDRKAHNQRFCSKECRIRNWELEKGIKLNFSKKSK